MPCCSLNTVTIKVSTTVFLFDKIKITVLSLDSYAVVIEVVRSFTPIKVVITQCIKIYLSTKNKSRMAHFRIIYIITL